MVLSPWMVEQIEALAERMAAGTGETADQCRRLVEVAIVNHGIVWLDRRLGEEEQKRQQKESA